MPYVQREENLAKCRQQPEKLMPGVAELLAAPPPTIGEYNKAKTQIAGVLEQWDALFSRYDIICSPTMPMVAPLIPDGWISPYRDNHMGTHYTSVVNVSHGSAASFPCGTVDGLPVGLHVMAASLREARVLRVCKALEILNPWTRRPVGGQ